MFAYVFLTAILAALPSVQAAPAKEKEQTKPGHWMELDCYVANVKTNGNLMDPQNPSLKYDWQLTQQTCVNNYKGLANYDNGKGRCVSINPDGLYGVTWWNNCVQQAKNGWYDVDRTNGQVVISHAAYHSDQAEGRGYVWNG